MKSLGQEQVGEKMDDQLALDGQNKHETVFNVMNCFFCCKDKKNCSAYTVSLHDNPNPILESYRGQKFAICAECFAKGHEYIAKQIIEFVLCEKKLLELNMKGGFRGKKKRR